MDEGHPEEADFEISREDFLFVTKEHKIFSDIIGILFRSTLCLSAALYLLFDKKNQYLSHDYIAVSIIFFAFYIKLSFDFFMSMFAYMAFKLRGVISHNGIYNMFLRILIIFIILTVAIAAFRVTESLGRS
jgi:hypothetical protein